MKKILIALPLVLIMILSMVPVFAADRDVKIVVRFWNDVQKSSKHSEVILNETVDQKIADDKAELMKYAVQKADALEKPVLNTKTNFKWQVVADKKMSVAASETAGALQITNEALVTKMSAQQLLAIVAKSEPFGLKLEVTEKANVWANIEKNPSAFFVADDQLIQDLNAAVKDIADGKAAKFTIAADKINETGATLATAASYVTRAASTVAAGTVYVDVFPGCFLEAPDKVEKPCYIPCEDITVKVFDAYNRVEVKRLERKFEVVNGNIPEISAAIEYMVQLINKNGYRITAHWDLTPAIFAPENLKDCVATIQVTPSALLVDVFHELYNCCKNPDGTMSQQNGYPYMSFLEEDVYVPFVEFTTQRIINQVKAEEWATTRIQKLNSGEWVFESAQFVDVLDPGRYLTGKVMDANGNYIDDIARWHKQRVIERPTIIIKYRAAVCVEKTEEKVDNATVENGNATTAPVTANGGANLPATGAKDVSAFFLSAVALLGLGIFFAKKH